MAACAKALINFGMSGVESKMNGTASREAAAKAGEQGHLHLVRSAGRLLHARRLPITKGEMPKGEFAPALGAHCLPAAPARGAPRSRSSGSWTAPLQGGQAHCQA